MLSRAARRLSDTRVSDWTRRPLTDAQCRYAASDVAHLLDLHAAVARRLGGDVGRALGWLGWLIGALFIAGHYAFFRAVTGQVAPAALADRLAAAPPGVHPWVADGAGRVRWGTSIYPQPVDWAEFLRVVRWTEELGYDGYFAYDHPTARADCWTALAALATARRLSRRATPHG